MLFKLVGIAGSEFRDAFAENLTAWQCYQLDVVSVHGGKRIYVALVVGIQLLLSALLGCSID
jgi:hypothetical protein